jgi:hypothetical protein
LIGENVRVGRRITNAVLLLFVNSILWIVIPAILSNLAAGALAGLSSNLPLANLNFIYAWGATVTGLFVIGALTEGKALSVPFVSGGSLAAALYVWLAANGGTLTLSFSGLQVSVSFQVVLFLLVLPSLFNSLRFPVEFLLERSEVAREAKNVP